VAYGAGAAGNGLVCEETAAVNALSALEKRLETLEGK
jgi:hypothetical protein